MASDKVEIKVAIEKEIHDGMKKALTEIRDRYGLSVTHMSVSWIDIGTTGGHNAMIDEIIITTKSRN